MLMALEQEQVFSHPALPVMQSITRLLPLSPQSVFQEFAASLREQEIKNGKKLSKQRRTDYLPRVFNF